MTKVERRIRDGLKRNSDLLFPAFRGSDHNSCGRDECSVCRQLQRRISKHFQSKVTALIQSKVGFSVRDGIGFGSVQYDALGWEYNGKPVRDAIGKQEASFVELKYGDEGFRLSLNETVKEEIEVEDGLYDTVTIDRLVRHDRNRDVFAKLIAFRDAGWVPESLWNGILEVVELIVQAYDEAEIDGGKMHENLEGWERAEEQKRNQAEIERIRAINEFLISIDVDGDGVVDIALSIDGLRKMIRKYQGSFTEVASHLLKDMSALADHLNGRAKWLNALYAQCRKEPRFNDEAIDLLREGVSELGLMIGNSLNMVLAISKGELLLFWDVYREFDEFGIFDSAWERRLQGQLSRMDSGLQNMIREIRVLRSEQERHQGRLIEVMHELSDRHRSFYSTSRDQLIDELRQIDSSVKWNSAIQAYGIYRQNS